jgi:hypothetical protein
MLSNPSPGHPARLPKGFFGKAFFDKTSERFFGQRIG